MPTRYKGKICYTFFHSFPWGIPTEVCPIRRIFWRSCATELYDATMTSILLLFYHRDGVGTDNPQQLRTRARACATETVRVLVSLANVRLALNRVKHVRGAARRTGNKGKRYYTYLQRHRIIASLFWLRWRVKHPIALR